MIKNINIRFNLDKEEHRKAWDYMQTMDRSVEKTYSKVIIKSLIRYFENADAENKAEISENYWERFRSEIGNLLRGQTALPAVEMENWQKKRTILCQKSVKMCWMHWKICFEEKVAEKRAVLADGAISREKLSVLGSYSK